MNNKPIEGEKEPSFSTKTAMGWVSLSYIFRSILIIIAAFVAAWFLVYPRSKAAAVILLAVASTVVIAECIRRILRCRAKLRFVGKNLSVNDYCKSSFRLDGLTYDDFLLVQNPSERWVDTGRLLIRKKGIYLRGVADFKALTAYIEENFEKNN